MFNTDYLDNIFYIYPSKRDADSGKSVGASGFFVMVDSGKDYDSCYLYGVTNAHVLEELRKDKADKVYIRFNKKNGGIKTISMDIKKWNFHPEGDDLAVCYLPPDEDITIRAFYDGDFLSKEHIRLHGIGVGDSTSTVGRYSLHSGTLNNRPAVRFGRVSMLPHEPVRQASRSFSQESFLVETYSINGFSGSPVYLSVGVDSRRGAIEPIKEAKTFLLGVDWGHFDFDGTVRIDPFMHTIRAPSGMMCVVPAWKLKELLYTKELVKARNVMDTHGQQDSACCR